MEDTLLIRTFQGPKGIHIRGIPLYSRKEIQPSAKVLYVNLHYLLVWFNLRL